MSASSWPTFLDDPQKIYSLYDGEPDLGSCDLFYFLADERGASITLGFETPHMPQHRRHEWESPESNSFEFYLVFIDVRGLATKGWNGPAHKDVAFTRDATGEILVEISSKGTSVSFQATSASLVKSRVSVVSRND
ncbi:Imm50 family immunity protein [Streptomyces sp. NPDC058405]|uniref:Imm50 family immunity protein n=1 Tax=Streptomyces sp. NPDC058405 TaxID=3346482 RepID=UPI00366918E6